MAEYFSTMSHRRTRPLDNLPCHLCEERNHIIPARTEQLIMLPREGEGEKASEREREKDNRDEGGHQCHVQVLPKAYNWHVSVIKVKHGESSLIKSHRDKQQIQRFMEVI